MRQAEARRGEEHEEATGKSFEDPLNGVAQMGVAEFAGHVP